MAETFMMTKLIVADLAAEMSFYEAVCGLRESHRVQAVSGDRAFVEVILASSPPSSAALVLLAYQDGQPPPAGECVLVFETDDIEAFTGRAIEAGGTVSQSPRHLPELALSYVMLGDPEGHVVEGLQRHGSARTD